MTSTSVTTVGGVTIITQVIPKDDSIPLQNPANPAAQAPPPVVKTPPPLSVEERSKALFLRGEPQGLGIVQIFIGLLCVSFSLTAVYSPVLILYAPFGLGGLFVVSGSLAVAAGRRTSVRLVWVSLLSNGFSVLLGVAAVVYVCVLLAGSPPTDMICSFLTADVSGSWKSKCPQDLWRLNVLLYGLLGLFLVLAVLQVCVSVAVCVFSGKILRNYKPYSPIMDEADDENAPRSASGSDLLPESP